MTKLLSELEDFESKAISYKNTKESETVVNENGGKQSKVDARFDLVDPLALKLLAECLGFGAAKYGEYNWLKISTKEHLNHALAHINAFQRGDTSEPHLINAFCRTMMALRKSIDEFDLNIKKEL
jgi:hypothetical protein